MKKILTAIGSVMAALALVVGAMAAPVTRVLAVDPVPTPYTPDATASQLLVNGVGSIQTTLFSIAGLIWPYAIGVLLFFLVIRFGMSFFRHH
jgi:fluoride ion exporter CrcB/FEX